MRQNKLIYDYRKFKNYDDFKIKTGMKGETAISFLISELNKIKK